MGLEPQEYTETKLTAKKFVEQACETGSFIFRYFDFAISLRKINENIAKLFAKTLTFVNVIITKNDRNRHQY